MLVGRAVGKAGHHYLLPSELGLPASMVKRVVFSYVRLPQSLARARVPLAFHSWAYGTALARRLGRVRARRPAPRFCLVHGLIYPGLSLPHWSHSVAARKLDCIHGVDPLLTDPSVRRFIEPFMNAAAAQTDAFLPVRTSPGADGYLIPSKSPQTLAETSEKLLGDADLRKRVGAKGRQTAQKFTWDGNFRRLMELAHTSTDAPLRGGEAIESPLLHHGN